MLEATDRQQRLRGEKKERAGEHTERNTRPKHLQTEHVTESSIYHVIPCYTMLPCVKLSKIPCTYVVNSQNQQHMFTNDSHGHPPTVTYVHRHPPTVTYVHVLEGWILHECGGHVHKAGVLQQTCHPRP